MEDVRVLKLVSGETIVASTKPTETFVKVVDPIQFTVVSRGGYGTMMASEWLQTNQNSFKIKRDHIVAMAYPTEMMLDYYFNSVNEIANQENEEETSEEFVNQFVKKMNGNSPTTLH